MTINFIDLWTKLEADEKRALAAKADTSVAYLSQVANGQRRAGRKTIGNLVSADERISFQMFFRDTDRPHDESRC